MKKVESLLSIWRSMHNRCCNSNQKAYKHYGGRGIGVCERWSGPQGYENFVFDMGERPDGGTLERRNNEGWYSPDNCCWASRAEQNRNKRTSRRITANGETLVMAEWAKRLGCQPAAILYRLRSGMSEQEAVTKPIPIRPNSKITDEQAKFVRQNYPLYSAQKLATLVGASKKSVLNIIHSKTFVDII